MFAPSKPVIIAVTGVAGLVIVIGGVLVLRQRARPVDNERVVPVVQEEIRDATEVPSESVDSVEPTDPTIPTASAPAAIDSDGDGLNDQEERQIGTSMLLRDTDGDGETDYDEVRVARTNPLQVSVIATEPAGVDSSTEVTTTTSSAPEDGDRDGDGLRDRDEVVNYQTNPDNPDTDADGYSDGQEVQKGYNPRGPGKCEQSTCLP